MGPGHEAKSAKTRGRLLGGAVGTAAGALAVWATGARLDRSG